MCVYLYLCVYTYTYACVYNAERGGESGDYSWGV